MRKVVVTSVALRQGQVERLRAVQARLCESRSELMRRAVEQFLAGFERPARRSGGAEGADDAVAAS